MNNRIVASQSVEDEISDLKFKLELKYNDSKYYRNEKIWADNIMIESDNHANQLLESTIKDILEITERLHVLESIK